MKIVKNTLLIAFLFLCLGCTRAQKLTSLTPLGELQGAISPNVPATIIVYQGDAKIQQIAADPKNGKFGITDLSAGEYILDIAYPGFQISQKNVTISEEEITYLEIVLTPILSPEPEPAVTLPPQSQQPDQTNKNVEFVPGEIIVGFEGNITLEEAQQIVNSQGLKGEWNNAIRLSSFWVVVHVPDGTEQYWIDIFKKMVGMGKIRYAELNHIYHACL